MAGPVLSIVVRSVILSNVFSIDSKIAISSYTGKYHFLKICVK